MYWFCFWVEECDLGPYLDFRQNFPSVVIWAFSYAKASYFPFLWRTFGCGGHFRIQRYHVLGVLWSLNSVLVCFWVEELFAWSGKTGQKSRYMGFSMERCHFPFLWRSFGCGGHFRIQRYRVLGVLWSLNSVLGLCFWVEESICLVRQNRPKIVIYGLFYGTLPFSVFVAHFWMWWTL